MIQPEFVKAGDPIKASNINALVSAARSTRRTTFPDSGNVARRWRPFDVMDVNKEGTNWLIRIQPGFFINGATASAVLAQDNTTSTEKPLTDFPDILVQSDKNLYFKYSQRKLIWEAPATAATQNDLLLLVSFTVAAEGNELSFTNHHPAPIYAKPIVPFAVSVAKVGEVFKASIAPGYVRNLLPMQELDAIDDFMPTIDGTALDATPAPSLEVADGDWIYCLVETDHKNNVTSDPEIFIGTASTVNDTNHYQPESPDLENGTYYFPIASISISAGENAVATVKQKQAGGPIVILPNLLEFEHVGGKREVFKRLRKGDSVYEFRTLESLAGDGEEIIKPIAEGETEAEKETIQFRRIRKGDKDQIKVKASDDKDAVIVEGNGYVFSGAGIKQFGIGIYDGLITNFDLEEGGGWWGEVLFTSGGGKIWGKMVFEDGNLQEVYGEDYGSGPTPVAGTQEAPGSAIIIVDDD